MAELLKGERQGLIMQIIVLHSWRHQKHDPKCEVCRCIQTGKWPK